MSAIGAIFNFNNRPFGEEDLHDLTALWQSLRKWGPDGGRFVTSDSLGVCYQAFNTTREARFEDQPLVAPHRAGLRRGDWVKPTSPDRAYGSAPRPAS